MYSDSRKAQHNSFAYHRAQLLFSRRLAETGDTGSWLAAIHEGTEPADGASALRRRVVAGLLGFKPAAAAAAAQ